MRRPGHALRFSDVSDSGGDGRHSLASGGDGRESLASEATGRTMMPLAFAGHAKLTAALGRVAMPYGLKLALCSVAFVACVLSLSLANFSLGREFCRATVGYGCLRG